MNLAGEVRDQEGGHKQKVLSCNLPYIHIYLARVCTDKGFLAARQQHTINNATCEW